MLYKFNILFLLSYLNYNIMSISSLSSSSTVQHTINDSCKDVYEYFEFISVAFATLFNTQFDKIIYHRYTKTSQSCEKCAFYTDCVNYAGNCCLLCWHYAHCFAFLLYSKLCQHNRSKATLEEIGDCTKLIYHNSGLFSKGKLSIAIYKTLTLKITTSFLSMK